jgi:hypothetical protein
MTDLIRIRLTALPSARDLEYLVLRYLLVNGIYEAPVAIACELIELGCASLVDSSQPLSALEDRLPQAGVDVNPGSC